MNRKKLMLFFLTSVLAVGNLIVPAAANYGSDSNYMRIERGCSGATGIDEETLVVVNEEKDIGSVLSTFFKKKVSKTVKKMYTDRNLIPTELNYVEYIDEAWYGGNLPRTDERYVRATGLYEVTFSGKLYLQSSLGNSINN